MSYDNYQITNSFINIFTKGWKTTAKIDNMEPTYELKIPMAKSILDINFDKNDGDFDIDKNEHKNMINISQTNQKSVEKKTIKDFAKVIHNNLSSNKVEQKKFVLYKFMAFIFKVLFIEFNIRNKTFNFDIDDNMDHITKSIFPDFVNSLNGYYSIWKVKKNIKFAYDYNNHLSIINNKTTTTFDDFTDKYRIRMKHGIDSVVSKSIPLEQKLTYNKILGQKLVIKNNKALLINGQSGYVDEQYPNFISNNIPLPYEPPNQNDKSNKDNKDNKDNHSTTFDEVLLHRTRYSEESGNNSLDAKFKQIIEAIDKITLLIKKVKVDLSMSYEYGEYTSKINYMVKSIGPMDKKYLIKISKEFNLLNSINI